MEHRRSVIGQHSAFDLKLQTPQIPPYSLHRTTLNNRTEQPKTEITPTPPPAPGKRSQEEPSGRAACGSSHDGRAAHRAAAAGSAWGLGV